MTVLDHFPRRTDWQPRLHRRHEIVTTGGYQVHEFVADVQDGVPYGSVTCTVALRADESALFAERLREVPTVIAVEPR
jgi:hypothetical protein